MIRQVYIFAAFRSLPLSGHQANEKHFQQSLYQSCCSRRGSLVWLFFDIIFLFLDTETDDQSCQHTKSGGRYWCCQKKRLLPYRNTLPKQVLRCCGRSCGRNGGCSVHSLFYLSQIIISYAFLRNRLSDLHIAPPFWRRSVICPIFIQ